MMEQEIQIFKNEQFGEIRTMLDEKGNPWFVGKDVAAVLGYSKPLNALAMHVDGDDSLKQGLIDSKGRLQQTIFINESGLYALILSSKLPQAKAFKRWVTSEVLPQIRQMIRMWIHRKYVLQITDNSFTKANINSKR